MRNIVIILIVCCCGIIPLNAQNTVLEKRIDVELNSVSMEDAIEAISVTAGINVSYSGDLFKDCAPVTLTAKNRTLLSILNTLFVSYKISYTVHAGQLILFPKKTMIVREHTITGHIRNADTGEAIAYATLQIKGKPKGVVADNEGFFELTLTEPELSDSLTASCLGYERRSFSSDTLLSEPDIIIALKEKYVDIGSVVVTAVKPRKTTKVVGNRRLLNAGSIYLDTHGQQIALYVDNEKHVNGYIGKVSYYLSDKGNVEAPFRVRILDVDTAKNSPGKDLLPEILVVQPADDATGWFDVDLSDYRIYVPHTGFFVAMQGIFPNDYSAYTGDSDFFEIGKGQPNTGNDFVPKSIHYGQRLGYSPGSGRNTWHYSLSHQWFQPEGRNYSVKISAEIIIYSKQK